MNTGFLVSKPEKETILDSLLKKIKGTIRVSVPMIEYTSFRVGGKADYLAFPADVKDLQMVVRWCIREGIPYFILGNGTNLLVRDGGIRGMVIALSRGFLRIEKLEGEGEDILVYGEAGESLGKLVEFCWKKGLSGLEFSAGIPGTIGGAIYMNAGAFGGEMKDVIDSLSLMDSRGNLIEKSKEELVFLYRSANLPQGEIVLGGKFHLRAEESPTVRSRVEKNLFCRKEKQPLDFPSAGSVFKNPPQGSAGRFIEEMGLKGSRLGDAEISEKHANFIVNRGRAQARDILALIARTRERVYQEKGIWLETEIQVVGED